MFLSDCALTHILHESANIAIENSPLDTPPDFYIVGFMKANKTTVLIEMTRGEKAKIARNAKKHGVRGIGTYMRMLALNPALVTKGERA